jgi:hypothetical protein
MDSMPINAAPVTDAGGGTQPLLNLNGPDPNGYVPRSEPATSQWSGEIIAAAPVQQAPQPAPVAVSQVWQQSTPVSMPQIIEPPPLPKPVDVGTAIIIPYMPNAGNNKIYRVQVGSFLVTWHAKEAFDRLTSLGFKPSYERYGDYIRVVISGIRAEDMPKLARLIGSVGFREGLIREEG